MRSILIVLMTVSLLQLDLSFLIVNCPLAPKSLTSPRCGLQAQPPSQASQIESNTWFFSKKKTGENPTTFPYWLQLPANFPYLEEGPSFCCSIQSLSQQQRAANNDEDDDNNNNSSNNRSGYLIGEALRARHLSQQKSLLRRKVADPRPRQTRWPDLLKHFLCYRSSQCCLVRNGSILSNIFERENMMKKGNLPAFFSFVGHHAAICTFSSPISFGSQSITL